MVIFQRSVCRAERRNVRCSYWRRRCQLRTIDAVIKSPCFVHRARNSSGLVANDSTLRRTNVESRAELRARRLEV